MANNTEKIRKSSQSDNAVVYKVFVALMLLSAGLLGLRRLRVFYGTIGGMDALTPLLLPMAIGGFALAIVAAIAGLAVRQKAVRAVAPWVVVVAAVVGFSALNMRLYWTEDFATLYFLVCAITVQFIVFQLYRWEFFLVSLSTLAAGLFFYRYSTSFAWDATGTLFLATTALILVFTALFAKAAAGNNGMLVFGHKRVHLFSAKTKPVLIYVIDILWLVCVAAALLLGSLFAYYCMFAAIAVEFIAAVYYTFQLN